MSRFSVRTNEQAVMITERISETKSRQQSVGMHRIRMQLGCNVTPVEAYHFAVKSIRGVYGHAAID